MALAQLRIPGVRWILLGTLISCAALLTAARLLMPLVGDFPREVAQVLARYLGQEVRVEGVRGSWTRLSPRIELANLQVVPDAEGETPLRVSHAYVDIDVLASLLHWRVQPRRLVLVGLELTLRRHVDGTFSVGGLSLRPGSPHGMLAWLARGGGLGIDHGRLLWCDDRTASPCEAAEDVYLRVRGTGQRYQLQATGRLPGALGRSAELSAEVVGDPAQPSTVRGRAHLRASGFDLGGWQRVSGQSAWPLGHARLEGKVDLDLWSDWNGPALEKLSGDIAAYGLLVQSREAAQPWRADRVSATLDWQRSQNGWQLAVQRLSMNRAGSTWPASRMTLRGNGRQVELASGFARLQDLVPLAKATSALPPRLESPLAGLQPVGDVYDLHVVYPLRQGDGWALAGRFVDLGFASQNGLPGIQGIDGRLRAGPDAGELVLASQGATLRFDRWFREPIGVTSASATASWQRDAGGWTVVGDGLELSNPDIGASARFSLQIPEDGTSPLLSLAVSFRDGRAEHARRYIPARVLKPRAVRWLDRAFIQGRIVRGEALFQGRLQDFPFDAGNGRFEVHFHLSGGVVEFHPEWPKLEGVEADVAFIGKRMEVKSQAGRILGSTVREARAVIPDLAARPAVLQVKGQASGPTGDVIRVLEETPLRKRFARYLEGVNASGSSELGLDLTVPLAPMPEQVKGVLTLRNSNLDLTKQRINLRAVDGALSFAGDRVQGDGIRARLWDHEVSLQVATERAAGGSATVIRARGDMDMDSLRAHEPLWVLGHARGQTTWVGKLKLAHDPSKPVELLIQSPLAGVAVDLPAPFGKGADDTVALSLSRTFWPGRESLTFRYGDTGSGSFLFRDGPEGRQIEGGELRLGEAPAQEPASDGITLTGTVPRLNLGAWLDLLHAGPAGEGRASLLDSLRRLQVRAAEMRVLGQTLHAVDLSASSGPRGWAGHLASEESAGDFRLTIAGSRPTLTLSLDRLRIDREPAKGESHGRVDPDSLPRVQMTSQHVYLGDEDLGQLHVTVMPHAREVALEKLRLQGPLGEAEVQGRWLTGRQADRSELSAVVQTQDLGHLLRALEFASPLEGGKAKLTTQLAWPGDPFGFSLGSAQGELDLRIRDGRLTTLDPGVGRVFGLLSLQALPRRLTLDFRDVVDKGFAFDRIGGTFTIGQGQAYTRGLRMDSPVAHVEVTGRVGLVAQDYDQRAKVVPHVSSSLPWAAALGGGVGVGVGAALFVVQTLFGNPLDKMASYEYSLTGSWRHPVVKRIEAVAAGP